MKAAIGPIRGRQEQDPLRRATACAWVVALLLGLAAGTARAAPVEVRIGYQKSSALMALLKARGTLEERVRTLGARVTWSEFANGAPLLEALNADAIDVAADVADAVPVFAAAAGAAVTYYAEEAPSPTAQAIIVPAGSPLRSVADLRGKQVAVTKAAGAHYLLLAALKKAGVPLAAVRLAYLAPAEARAAFETGSVDACATWDPYLATVQQQAGARILVDGTGLASYRRVYVATSRFVAGQPALLQAIVDSLRAAGRWVKAHPQEAASELGAVWRLAPPVADAINKRRSYDVRPVSRETLIDQQAIADAFFSAGLLPRPIDVKSLAVWGSGASASARP